MFRKFRNYSSFTLAGTTMLPRSYDIPKLKPGTEIPPNVNETGMDRLYEMYTLDEFGVLTPEMTSVLQASMGGIVAGIFIGGFIQSRAAYMNFMEREQATAFTSHFEAKKKLQDKVTLGMGKGAFRWGWRLGLFTGSYQLITSTVSVYRGRSGILEYMVAGGVTGAVYKCSLGVRGVVVGGLVGSVLGGIAGTISLGILRVTGMTMEEVRKRQYVWRSSRDEAYIAGMKQSAEKNRDPLQIQHDVKAGGIQLDIIPDTPTSSSKEPSTATKT